MKKSYADICLKKAIADFRHSSWKRAISIAKEVLAV